MENRITVSNVDDPNAAAMQLLRQTIAPAGRIVLPVAVEEVARCLGVEYRRMHLESGTDGLLVKDRPNVPFKAVVDDTVHPHRARFTLAHELGHYIHRYQNLPADKVAGKVEKRDELSHLGTDPEERWANSFAAALLMPPGPMVILWGQGTSVKHMADRFDVSVEAMRYRIDKLGLED